MKQYFIRRIRVERYGEVMPANGYLIQASRSSAHYRVWCGHYSIDSQGRFYPSFTKKEFLIRHRRGEGILLVIFDGDAKMGTKIQETANSPLFR